MAATAPVRGELRAILTDVLSYAHMANGTRTPQDGLTGYHRGVVLARAGQLEEAEELLRGVADGPDSTRSASRGAARALGDICCIHATGAAASGDLVGACQRLLAGTSSCPEHEGLAQLAATLTPLVPVSHLGSGSRDEAAKCWQGPAKKQGPGCTEFHCLAVLQYWWAMELAAQGKAREGAVALARCAELWALLINSNEFRERWRAARSEVYGKEIEPKHIEQACRTARETILRRCLKLGDEFSETGDSHSRALFLRSYAAAMGEFEAALLLKDLVTAFGDQAPKGVRIGGPRGLRTWGGVKKVGELLTLARRHGAIDEELMDEITLAYAVDAPEWGMVRAKQYDDVIRRIDNLDSPSRGQRQLLAQAYCDKGLTVGASGDVGSGLELMLQALRRIPRGRSIVATRVGRAAMATVKPLFDDIGNQRLEDLKAPVRQLRRMAESLESPAFRENLGNCLLQYSRLYARKGDNSTVTTLLEEALQFSPNSPAIRRDLSFSYRQEAHAALQKEDLQTCCSTLRRAHGMDPSNQQVRSELSILLTGLAVQQANEAAQAFQRTWSGQASRQRARTEMLRIFSASEDMLQEAAALDPSNAAARQQRDAILAVRHQLLAEVWD